MRACRREAQPLGIVLPVRTRLRKHYPCWSVPSVVNANLVSPPVDIVRMNKTVVLGALMILASSATCFNAATLANEARSTPSAVSSDKPEADRVYLAVRTDNKQGSGTAADPFDASTAFKFDALMAKFWETHGGKWAGGEYKHGKPLTIQLGAGVFEAGALASYGFNVNGPHAMQNWLARGWTLRGAGMLETEIRNVSRSPSGIFMFNSSGGTWGGPESGGITISDLTLNPQKSVHEDSTNHEVEIIEADGTTTTVRAPGHGWRLWTRIELSGENYSGARGPYDGGGWKLVTAITPDTFSWKSSNTRTGLVKIKRVGEWNAIRINGPSNRVERVRVIDAGANSIAEMWPLWVGGDNLVIDGCVVERCTGLMSAIGAFPGTNRTIRNCRVDSTGCGPTLGIAAVELVENNTVVNATHGIYADTFASSVPIHVRNNVIENPNGAAILIRPHDHTKNIFVRGNRVVGGDNEVGVWIDPLSGHWSGSEWQSAKGEKIWIDDVVVEGNDIGDKRIEMAQTRGVTIKDNIVRFGVFYRMPNPANVSGNRTSTGQLPFGLEDTIGVAAPNHEP